MGDCEELSLELSIGGKYAGKSNLNANCESGDVGNSETVDLQRRREIQASRRQEARRKREEKVKRSRGVGFVNDKLFLETQRFQGRIRGREIREKEFNFERKDGSCEVADGLGLGLSLFSEKNQSLYPKVQLVEPKSDSENSNGVKSVGHCSHYYSMSQKGGAGSKQESSSPASESGGEARKGERRLPCVSATGEGPNAKTVMGFLHKYDKREVSIMCVCHGSLFSPAEFMEHAGCGDVSNPLRRITVVTS
ncbi:ninja-family protein AFP3-like [Salvia divinorum]|uniref:Ninja-family protein n=1 Tax=Salvia divinorum TaxID=28513 RepID=A0ABD1GA70_SALDI